MFLTFFRAIFLTQKISTVVINTQPSIETQKTRLHEYVTGLRCHLHYEVTTPYYSFTPPSATPAMMYFDNAKYTMKIGITVITKPT